MSATRASSARPTLGDLTFDLAPDELRRRSEARLDRARRAVDAAVAGPRTGTIASVLEPINSALAEVRDTGSHGSLIFAVHTDAATRTAGREVSEAADQFVHAFRLNERAYAALRALDLGHEAAPTRFAVDKLLREMRRAGVEKDAATRARLLDLNRRIDLAANRFTENIANHDRSIELTSADDLAGLPSDYVAAHPPGPAGTIVLTTRYPDFLPVMAYAERTEVRRRMLFEFANRAYPTNVPVLVELLELRHEFARLLGYPSYAAYAIEDKMLRSPEAVRELLERIATLLRCPARADLARYLARKRRDHPNAPSIEPWEAQFYGPGYYDQKIRSEEFGVDMRQVRTYLPFGRVRDGLFELCEELFGIRFTQAAVAAWHPTVLVYDVARRGEPLGRIYLDLTPRDGKYTHAACFTVRDGVAGVQLPQAALICNFVAPGPAPETTRLEYTEVVTFFHEFGHLLHALLSGHQRWLYNSQSNLEWDFIEAPSQLFEEWARDPATLRRFAVDPESGERIPEALVARLRASSSLGRSLGWLRQVSLSSISLELYSLDPRGRDVSEATRAHYARYAPDGMPADYHFEAAFGHLTGYSAFYYTYVWSAVIARDLLSPFFERGSLTDREVAERYAREILVPGSERPAAELIRAYLGRDFGYDAFERWATEPAVAPTPSRARRPTARPRRRTSPSRRPRSHARARAPHRPRTKPARPARIGRTVRRRAERS